MIKYKPTDNNKIFLFSESCNLLILVICFIWVIDDKINFLTEDDRSNIGWFGISLLGFVFVVNLLSTFVVIIGVNKDRMRRFWEKC